MVLAVASIVSLMMSAALFGRRPKRGTDDPPVPGGRSVSEGPNLFVPDAAPRQPTNARQPTREPAPAPATGPEIPADPPLVDPSTRLAEATGAGDQDHDGLIGAPLLAELEARIHSTNPAPHPVRPQEMWHPDVTPQPVDLPPPPTEERIDQAELEGAESAPGRFRFNRLRRVSPGEATVSPPEPPAGVAPAEQVRAEPVGDVLFGELFTSDRIPSGTEGLGSGAAPLVPPSGGASGALINGPVRRNPRAAGRSLSQVPDVQPLVEAQGGPDAGDVDHEPAAAVPVAPLDDPGSGPVVDQALVEVDDHVADLVVEPTVAAEQEPESRQLTVTEDGSVDVDGTSLRLAPDADAIVTDDDSTVSVSLTEGWCWAALSDDAEPLKVFTAGIVLQCPAATTLLVTVDDAGRFVVVVRGEAALAVGGRRIRLRTGAMAFLPHGSDDAQVDVATEAEIASDPLVARNLGLDAAR